MVDADDPLTGGRSRRASTNGTTCSTSRRRTHGDLIRWINGGDHEQPDRERAVPQGLGERRSQLGHGAATRPRCCPPGEIMSRLGSIDMSLGQLNGLAGRRHRRATRGNEQPGAAERGRSRWAEACRSRWRTDGGSRTCRRRWDRRSTRRSRRRARRSSGRNGRRSSSRPTCSSGLASIRSSRSPATRSPTSAASPLPGLNPMLPAMGQRRQ